MSAPYAVVVTSTLASRSCPTCGSSVRVVGNTTKHFEPQHATPNVYGPSDQDEADALARRVLETNEHVSAVVVELLPWIE